ALDARARGLRAVAITSNFAPIRPDLEVRAEAIFRAVMPDARITLSHQVGGLGLIDRESAAVINASMAALAESIVGSLVQAFASLGIAAPIFISQNDGTLITTAQAATYPIFTCSAGPTNSIRGAAFLTGLDEAVVADIGGTTTDVGFLSRGFPRETAMPKLIGGVRTNFRMPDILSIGLGGGSVVRAGESECEVGPDSVGHRLQTEALAFGGSTLTATDIAIAAGQATIGEPSRVAGLTHAMVGAALDRIHRLVEEAIDRMKTSEQPLPLILVGGGAILINRPVAGTSRVLRPDHATVANAVGAAIALVSGRVDKLYDVAALGRDAALDMAKAEARAAAVAAGAAEATVEVIEVVELPMTHMKAGTTQIRVRAVGELAEL
ncbi:hydantoinase/oxoprolinase family protein, partial [Sphingomonas sp.]|uniref:hydantoinase/oxoprolinase family protein n=1 Tax=Sphingomonas sp. TaxID=28214 RepID=UPI0035BC87D5